jgi:hypothetical protein
MTWVELLSARVVPAEGAVRLGGTPLVVAVVGALAAVGVPGIWRVVRLAVTLVHELGHAVVGVLVGRRFTGFVLRADMSGHAVTVGRPNGLGRVVTTWAGYPAPGVLGAGMVWLALHGWSAALVTGVLVVLLGAALRVRSLLTALVMVVATAGAACLWWWRADERQAQLVVGLGVLLVFGAWRHLGAVATKRARSAYGSDPRVLADLTHVPALVWTATFGLVLVLATGVAGASLLSLAARTMTGEPLLDGGAPQRHETMRTDMPSWIVLYPLFGGTTTHGGSDQHDHRDTVTTRRV